MGEVAINDQDKSQAQLIEELAEMRQQLAALEELKIKHAQTREALLEGQVRMLGILDISSEAIISIDETQRIIFFNKGAEKIFGYASDEVMGQPLDILLPARFVAAHRRHIGAFALSTTTARLMGERQEIFGLRKNGEEFPAEASISKIEMNGGCVFTVVLRNITERKQIERHREKLILELRSLNEATRLIAAELSLEDVLQKIIQAAQTLIEVKFAALGIHDGHGKLSRFITAGISAVDQAKIGALPTGRGLLGVLLHQGESLIIKDMSDHPAAVGFPEHHPKMRSLLGAPIFSKNALIGALYLADKRDGSEFTQTDQQLIEMLALHAAIAIENAQLYQKTQRLAILEERERFARDLHDGIIQSIYAVGLSLDNVKAIIPDSDATAKEQIQVSLKSLADVINDLRSYIFDLRPQAMRTKGLRARLEALIKELKANTSLSIQAEIAADINTYLEDQQARHIFHIAHEALSNAARHAKAQNIYLSLVREEAAIILRVEDDGRGFEPPLAINLGHQGLANIQKRASLLGATLEIESSPGQGARLALTLPISSNRKPEVKLNG